jgi:DNA-binding NtrC family response regulator
MEKILIISKTIKDLECLQPLFDETFTINHCSKIEKGTDLLKLARYDLIIFDIDLIRNPSESTYKKALQSFWYINSSVKIVVMSEPESVREAVKVVKAGAWDYLNYPMNPAEVKYLLERIRESIKLKSELDYLRDQFWQNDCLESIHTNNVDMKNVYNKIRMVAPTKSTVLLTGETGTGKSVIAKLIHRHSNRQENQFISIHCGAIPDNLIESEFFGHEKGAFTGAIKKRTGKFEIANGGTIFLDEIGTITPAAQIKLLKVLQDQEFYPVGSEKSIKTNVRIIAATNVDLKELCEDGAFRLDLYYRLNVFPIEVIPLRKRLEDISYFVDFFLKRLNQFHQKEINGISPQVIDALLQYKWPGNIRELENLIERAFILETSNMLTPESFPNDFFENTDGVAYLSIDTSLPLALVRKKAIEDIERNYLKEVLTKNKGVINISAKDTGVSVRQFHKLMCRYGLQKKDFKIGVAQSCS